jgi:hypothetical protein
MPISPDILAVTHTELMKTIPDAIARSNALLNKLVKKRSMPFNGGNLTFQFPVAILDNEAEGWIDGSTDVISTNPNQEMVYGQLTYKKFYSNVVVSLNDIAATDDSPNAIASLIEIKKNVAQNTMTRTVSASVWGVGQLQIRHSMALGIFSGHLVPHTLVSTTLITQLGTHKQTQLAR